jgi:hypothetical protein
MMGKGENKSELLVDENDFIFDLIPCFEFFSQRLRRFLLLGEEPEMDNHRKSKKDKRSEKI